MDRWSSHVTIDGEAITIVQRDEPKVSEIVIFQGLYGAVRVVREVSSVQKP